MRPEASKPPECGVSEVGPGCLICHAGIWFLSSAPLPKFVIPRGNH